MAESGINVGAAADVAYFNSYDDISVHKMMLNDRARVLAYKQFMERNRALFTDKIVVDIGCGTGILSLFAAYYGAKHVYAIEAAPHVSALCKEIIECNGYADRVTVLAGRAEDVQLPDGILADVLISEWMGFYLLHESMLESVIAARDRLLRSGGAIFPSSATVYACPVSIKQFCIENFEFWRNVYGFDFSAVGHQAHQACLVRPEIMQVPDNSLLSEPQPVLNIDLQFVGADDVRSIMASLDFVINRNDVMHGFALWFDVTFEGVEGESLVLDTSPTAPPTHWKQTVVLLPDALLVNKESHVTCRIVLQQAEDAPRRYNITVEMPEDSEVESGEDQNVVDVEMFGQCSVQPTAPLNSAVLQQCITKTMDRVI